MMSNRAIKEELTRLVFQSLEEARLSYCGVGTVEKILSPESRDIDVFVRQEDIQYFSRILENVYQSFGWKKLKKIKNEYSLQLFFGSPFSEGEKLEFTQWDIMPWSSWRGVQFVDASRMVEEAKSKSGVRYLGAEGQESYKLVRSLLCNPATKEEKLPCEESVLVRAAEMLLTNKKSMLSLNGRTLRRQFFLKKFCRRPLSTATGFINFLVSLFHRYLEPPGLVIGLPNIQDKDGGDVNEASVLRELPVSGVKMISADVWEDFLNRLKFIRYLFLGGVIVVAGCQSRQFESRRWRLVSYLFKGEIDRAFALPVDKQIDMIFFKKKIREVLRKRL